MTNYQFTAGDSQNFNLAFTGSDGVTPEDITSWVITFTLKTDKHSADDDATLQIEADITDGAGGLATVSISAENARDLLGTYYYDIQYQNGTEVKTVMEGVMTWVRDITISIEV